MLLTAVPFPDTSFYITDTTSKEVILSLPKARPQTHSRVRKRYNGFSNPGGVSPV